MHEELGNEEPIRQMDASHARTCAAQRGMLFAIAEADRRKHWEGSGARDMAHLLSIRYGISCWKAKRWVAAAHALEELPLLAQALSSGELGIDKVVELARFATPSTEAKLICWAKGVSCGAIRHRGDLASRSSLEETVQADRERALSWWYLDEGRRFGLYSELPAAQGAVVARAIERMAEKVPSMPGEEDPFYADARRADALVAICSARIADDQSPDRATVVVHTNLDALSGDGGSELEGGGIAHPETARRLGCNARIQVLVEDQGGDPIRLGRVSREPPSWMIRQLRYRDRECRFPGCGARRFTQAHHIVWWENGGRTDLENLVLICSFHHKLVHEYGWGIRREQDGTVSWFRPDGARYRAGPAPPPQMIELQPALAAVGSYS